MLRANSGTLSQVGGKASHTVSRRIERALGRRRERLDRRELLERTEKWSVGEPLGRKGRGAVFPTDGVDEAELAGA